MSDPHLPVLIEEVLHLFEGCHLRYYLDGTLGAGGHAQAILEHHPEIETFIGLDQDPTALALARERLSPWKDKLILEQVNFTALQSVLDAHQIPHVEGMLFDLGVSSMQLDQPGRGFSFMREGPLDMRMDPTTSVTAATLVNTWTEQELTQLFRRYGEEKRCRRAARAIVEARAHQLFTTTKQLADLLESVLPKEKRGIHPATKVFQALRLCVNQELEVLEQVLPQAIEKLSPGGRLAVITFHSLEDRPVKHFFRDQASDKESTSGRGGMFLDKTPLVKVLTRKPLCATEQEIQKNPRSRSAKLRAVEKI